MYHIPTALLIIGLLYIFLPIIVWLVLRHQTSRTVTLWCWGGGVFALGLLFLAARTKVPLWVTYPLANTLAWAGILMQAMSLRYALRKPIKLLGAVLLVSVWLLVFEYFRLVMQSDHYRFAWALLLYVLVFMYIASLAWRIASTLTLDSGRWLSIVYLLAATALSLRIVLALSGLTQPEIVASGIDSILTVITGILISVVGSFAFVSMFLERAAKREIAEAEARVRQEESARLGDQIAQLERQRTLGAMSYSFAHELSQPLTAILMDTQAIKSSLQAPTLNLQEISESVSEVEKSATRTVALIEGIRNFIRPTRGDHERVDLKILVRDVEQLLSRDIRQQHIHFGWDFDEADCVVRGDKVQLSQVVLNVYRNAMQAMADQPVRKIDVALERDDSRVVLRVHDSGPGLNEARKDQVGQPFVTTKADGLGVGLSISRTIAEMHGGSLNIANAVGGGAVVEMSLPVVDTWQGLH